MNKYFSSNIGRLRILGVLEGISFLFLLFIAMPMKYFAGEPIWVRIVGLIHGVLFILFIFNMISVGTERQWKFRETTWKVFLGSIVPFGTFYIDKKILKAIHEAEMKK